MGLGVPAPGSGDAVTVFDLAFAVGALCLLVTVLVCAGLVYELWEDWRDE